MVQWFIKITYSWNFLVPCIPSDDDNDRILKYKDLSFKSIETRTGWRSREAYCEMPLSWTIESLTIDSIWNTQHLFSALKIELIFSECYWVPSWLSRPAQHISSFAMDWKSQNTIRVLLSEWKFISSNWNLQKNCSLLLLFPFYIFN